MTDRIESGRLYTETLVTKYSAEAEEYLKNDEGILVPKGADFKAFGITPDEEIEGPQPGNLLLNIGINQLWRSAVDNTTEQAWDTTHTAIGVGDSSTAASAGQTTLSAATNKYFKTVDSGPTVGTAGSSTTTCIFIATFGTSVANFAWNEYGVVLPGTGTAFTSGTTHQANYYMLNRKAGAGLLGTKTGSQTWVFTVTMTLA